ncbi:TatD family hydrolase [Breznakiella homolactica]|uniref:TatD family hydrolase n=1 Tax=Breznakiella homolactica TaxID=2798577 RepID=A0A7T7XP34_9SPIR|nr:TatD family hydrolase [Breznakiella homolactica]QQO09914.1 TatD family hydrolase [Breznakiella homolactica]
MNSSDFHGIQLTDAHSHITGDRDAVSRVLREHGIYTLASTSGAAEYGAITALANPLVIPTFGIHPWKSGEINLRDVSACLEDAAIIGEIGMDSVWCDVPLAVQESQFTAQLEIARRRGVPVVLHTKGQEPEIARIIKPFELKVLVHWYSCDEYFELYRDLDCYFTVGPSVADDPAVRRVARDTPIDRILIETDGLDALVWAGYKAAVPADIPRSLLAAVTETARIRNMDREELLLRINENFSAFSGVPIENNLY